MSGALPLAVCPHCGEYAAAIDSTWCGACGHHLTLSGPGLRKMISLEKALLNAVAAAAQP